MPCAYLLIALVIPVPAGHDPEAILRRAIKAHGGPDKLEQLHRVRESTSGLLHLRDQQIQFTSETLQRHPGQFRHTLISEIDRRKIEILQVYDGKQGWLIEGGINRTVDDKALAGWKATVNAAYVATLTPLLVPDKGYRLSMLPMEKVLDRSALGIKISQEGQRDVSLYFDRETGLLVKKVLRPHAGGAKSVQEEIFSEFEEVRGLKRAMRIRILINGIPHADAVIRSTEFLERIDDKEFTKP